MLECPGGERSPDCLGLYYEESNLIEIYWRDDLSDASETLTHEFCHWFQDTTGRSTEHVLPYFYEWKRIIHAEVKTGLGIE
jgi:hypothetical protein